MGSSAISVVVNREGGTASSLGDALETKLREAFAATAAPINLHLVPGGEVAETVRRAPGEIVAVGGGDGTLACAAAVLCEQGRTLAVLPLGTRNHFALQLGLTSDLAEAAKVAATGAMQQVDVGMAGERLFLNNASIGLYTKLVRERERHALPKWMATIPAAWYVLWHARERRLSLSIDGTPRDLKTPLMFIGNNRYSLEQGQVGQRASLQDGVLSLFAISPRSGAGLALMALRILLGKADFSADFAAVEEMRELIVEGHGSHHVALDGEVTEMDFPLTFAIHPGKLAVMAPA